MTPKVENHFSEAHFNTISRFFNFWSCPYGLPIWQSHMAKPYGKTIWQIHMAEPCVAAVAAAAAAAIVCDGDVKLFHGI